MSTILSGKQYMIIGLLCFLALATGASVQGASWDQQMFLAASSRTDVSSCWNSNLYQSEANTQPSGQPFEAIVIDCPPGCPTYQECETHWDDCGHCGQPFEKTWWHNRCRDCCVCDGCDYWNLVRFGCDWCPP
jgi:hypothetical protein